MLFRSQREVRRSDLARRVIYLVFFVFDTRVVVRGVAGFFRGQGLKRIFRWSIRFVAAVFRFLEIRLVLVNFCVVGSSGRQFAAGQFPALRRELYADFRLPSPAR